MVFNEDTRKSLVYPDEQKYYSMRVRLANELGRMTVQNPISIDGDSVYNKDIDIDNSDNGDFTGTVYDYFDSLKTINENTTSNNPKIIKLWFNRTVYSHAVGLGCDDLDKGFGTSVTVKLLGSGEAVRFEKTYTGLDPNSALLQFAYIDQGGVKAFNGIQLEFNTSDTVCLSNITIQKSGKSDVSIQTVDEVTGRLDTVKSKDGALNVNQALVHTTGVNNFATQKTDTCTTMAQDTNQGNTTIVLTDATGFAVGDYIEFTNAGNLTEVTSIRITAINANTITIDRPLDRTYAAGTEVCKVIRNMAVTGTLANPVSYTLVPPDTGGPDSIWQITKITFHILDDKSMDDSKFGSTDPLPNGVVIRSIKANNLINTIAIWKKNGDVSNDVLPNHLVYTDASAAGNYAMHAGWILTNSEFIIELDGRLGEYAEVLVQDDLTSQTEVDIKFQGRIFGQ